jgi:hypothetical protein
MLLSTGPLVVSPCASYHIVIAFDWPLDDGSDVFYSSLLGSWILYNTRLLMYHCMSTVTVTRHVITITQPVPAAIRCVHKCLTCD